MARDLTALTAQLGRFLPEDLRPEEGSVRQALAEGIAAAAVTAESTREQLLDQARIDPGAGIWLQLQARDLGYRPLQGETDGQLRIRVRNVQNKVTRPAILTAVNELLATVTELPAYLWERMDGTGAALEEWALEEGALGPGWLEVILYLPALPPEETGWGLEEGALEEAWLESWLRHTAYSVIEAEVDRIRAAGIRVYYFYYLEA